MYNPIAVITVMTAGTSPIIINVRSSSLWRFDTRRNSSAEINAANPPVIKKVTAAVVPAASPSWLLPMIPGNTPASIARSKYNPVSNRMRFFNLLTL